MPRVVSSAPLTRDAGLPAGAAARPAGPLFKSVIAVLQADLETYESKSSATRELISRLQAYIGPDELPASHETPPPKPKQYGSETVR